MRTELEKLGEGTKIRIIAQYQHKACNRLLLLNVRPLEEYIKYDNVDNYYRTFPVIGHVADYPKIPIITDHVHLDIYGCDDMRLTKYRKSNDIVICTCDIYKYKYNNWLRGTCNYAIRNPIDIEVLRPVDFNGKLYFIPLVPDSNPYYWGYTGKGSRSCIGSHYWNFTQLIKLPVDEEKTYSDGSTYHKDGYKIVEEQERYLALEYYKDNSRMDIYKSLKKYLINSPKQKSISNNN